LKRIERACVTNGQIKTDKQTERERERDGEREFGLEKNIEIERDRAKGHRERVN